MAVYLFLFMIFCVAQAGAVEEDVGGSISYNENAPTDTDIPNWTIGWAGSGITGWDYVGEVEVGGDPASQASGVYLGNGWVLTAGHVGAGTFTLNGSTYLASGSVQSIVTSGTTADLTLFQIATSPALPSLTLSSTASFSSAIHTGDSVVMTGYGVASSYGPQVETWGLNTVTSINQSVSLMGYPFTSNDFETAYGTSTIGHGSHARSVTNNYQLYLGDSGGGDFMYDSTTGTWLLAGINEALDGSNDSYMVQLDTYATQINSITAVPEPSSLWLLGPGLLALLWKARLVPCRKRLSSPTPPRASATSQPAARRHRIAGSIP